MIAKTALVVVALLVLGGSARAQEPGGPAPTTNEAPIAPLAPETGDNDAAQTPPPEEAPSTSGMTSGVRSTVAESGGVFGYGLALAPKVGLGFGSVSLAGGGGVLTVELEAGYSLPIALPRGRDVEVFLSFAYSGPSTRESVAADDARLPGAGSFDYDLTLHQSIVGAGGLYRFPVDVVDWWRPYGAVALRMIWSATLVNGSAGGVAFGTSTETAFDVGGYAAFGSDFYVGPGAILVELQAASALADRSVLRATSTTALQIALGYRFYL